MNSMGWNRFFYERESFKSDRVAFVSMLNQELFFLPTLPEAWQHCQSCGRCALPDHPCDQRQGEEGCYICASPGHKHKACPRKHISGQVQMKCSHFASCSNGFKRSFFLIQITHFLKCSSLLSAIYFSQIIADSFYD